MKRVQPFIGIIRGRGHCVTPNLKDPLKDLPSESLPHTKKKTTTTSAFVPEKAPLTTTTTTTITTTTTPRVQR